VIGVHPVRPCASRYAAVRAVLAFATGPSGTQSGYNVDPARTFLTGKSPVIAAPAVGQLPTSPTIVVPASALVMPVPPSTAKLPAAPRLGANGPVALAFTANAKKINKKQVPRNFIQSSRTFG
jgi:hypothetical protein